MTFSRRLAYDLGSERGGSPAKRNRLAFGRDYFSFVTPLNGSPSLFTSMNRPFGPRLVQ